MFDADKNRMIALPYGEKNYDDMLSRFHLIPERYFGGVPKNFRIHRSDLQKALTCAERRVLSSHWFRSDAQCDLLPWQRKQKIEKRKKRQWKTGYSPGPPISPDRSQSLHVGWPPVYIL